MFNRLKQKLGQDSLAPSGKADPSGHSSAGSASTSVLKETPSAVGTRHERAPKAKPLEQQPKPQTTESDSLDSTNSQVDIKKKEQTTLNTKSGHNEETSPIQTDSRTQSSEKLQELSEGKPDDESKKTTPGSSPEHAVTNGDTDRKDKEIKLGSEGSTPTSPAEMSELKQKLNRAHSCNKALEHELEGKTSQLAELNEENLRLKQSIESNKQQALNELLNVSATESDLRSELSSTLQRLGSIESSYKSQGNLLKEKERAMSDLEMTLQTCEQDKRRLETDYKLTISELTASCDMLKTSLENETKTAVQLKEELDSLREDGLEKQLDDEKHLSDLHDQLSQLRGEIRQAERSKKREMESLQVEIDKRDLLIADAKAELKDTESQYNKTILELNKQIDELKAEVERQSASVDDVHSQNTQLLDRLTNNDKECDDLMMRNADLSSMLEKLKLEHKTTKENLEEERTTLTENLHVSETALHQKTEELDHLQIDMDKLRSDLQSRDETIDQHKQQQQSIQELEAQVSEKDKQLNEKNKSIKLQQQTINDLKKTIKRELKGHGEVAVQGEVEGSWRGSLDGMDRIKSSPDLSRLDRSDSPALDSVKSLPTASTLTAPPIIPTTSFTAASALPNQQYRHEVNGFCGHKDINFEYLKNVVFSFLISRDTESIHLVKAIAVLLEFTPAEERLLKETLEWKMSWWPTSKPKRKVRK